MALDKFQPYLFVSAGEQSNKLLTPTYSGGIASFQAQRAQSLTGLTVRIDPIQAGTGDPSPSNIRPISGRTGMTVTRASKNLMPNMAGTATNTTNGITFTYNDDGSFTINGTATANAYSRAVDGVATNIYLPRGTYKKPSMQNGNVGVYVQYMRSSSNWTTVTGGGTSSNTFVIDEDYPLAIRVGVMSGTTLNNVRFEPYIYPSSINDLTWESPVKQEYPITWQTQAGTIYGGTLNVTTGVLTVDKYFLTCADTITPDVGAYAYATNPNRWQIPLSGDYMPSNEKMGESISDAFGYYDGGFSQWTDGTFRFSSISNNQRFIQFKWAGQPTTADALKALLAENPFHFVIPLATPQTYQLTPTEVRTIAGFNQIYSDAGPVIDIKF